MIIWNSDKLWLQLNNNLLLSSNGENFSNYGYLLVKKIGRNVCTNLFIEIPFDKFFTGYDACIKNNFVDEAISKIWICINIQNRSANEENSYKFFLQETDSHVLFPTNYWTYQNLINESISKHRFLLILYVKRSFVANINFFKFILFFSRHNDHT